MRTLLEKRSKIVSDLRAITEAPQGEGGDLTAEQMNLFNALKADLGKVDAQIERQAILDDSERRMNGVSITGDSKLDGEMRSFSVIRAIQHQLGAKVDAGRELEISAELARMEGRSTDGILMPYSVFERRAADTITTTAPALGPGGNLIGTDHMGGQFIDMLREANPLTGLGMRVMSGLVGNCEIPRLKASTSVGWFGENSAIPQADAQMDSITLSPKHAGAWTEYSRNMLLQSSPDIEALLRSDLAQVLALEVARSVINGSGADAEPTGILATTGIQEIDKPATEMAYAPALAGALFENNVQNVSFIANSTFKATVDDLLTTDGLPIGSAAFFRNYPHKYASAVPAARVMVAGDFSQVIQGTWSAVELLINPYMESAFKKGNVAMRIVLTTDIAVRHPEAFATFKVA